VVEGDGWVAVWFWDVRDLESRAVMENVEARVDDAGSSLKESLLLFPPGRLFVFDAAVIILLVIVF
jgi:hypothetical protein